MSEIQELHGQIEFLKEHSARLHGEKKHLEHKLEKAAEEKSNLLRKQAEAENKALLAERKAAKFEAENRDLHKKLEVLKEFNTRLNEQVTYAESLQYVRQK